MRSLPDADVDAIAALVTEQDLKTLAYAIALDDREAFLVTIRDIVVRVAREMLGEGAIRVVQ